MSAERKQLLLRIDPALHDALARWAADELRSVNGQIELLLRQALATAGRAPAGLRPPNPRGRPKKASAGPSAGASDSQADEADDTP